MLAEKKENKKLAAGGQLGRPGAPRAERRGGARGVEHEGSPKRLSVSSISRQWMGERQ